MIYRHYFKRIIDLIAAGIMMIIFSPVFLLITICLFFANRRKPFFIQKRPGRDEKIFSILKFKTMNDKRDVHGKLLPDEKRITAIGRFIRKTSLDEIPQLINVIKGEMSLIGPRPLLIEYLPLYNERQKRRHEVRPGITGWAQVNGRNAISWQEKFELDVYYVEHQSFLLDLQIIFKTLQKVLLKKDINFSTPVEMNAFKGN